MTFSRTRIFKLQTQRLNNKYRNHAKMNFYSSPNQCQESSISLKKEKVSPLEETNDSWFQDTIVNAPENLDMKIPRWLKAKKRAQERQLPENFAVKGDADGEKQGDSSSALLGIPEIVSELERHAAIDIKVIDVSHKVDHLSMLVICNGRSARHAYSIADSIRILAKNRYTTRLGGNSLMMPDTLAMEGRDSEDWLLLDLGYVMVHVFTPQGRKDIDLESLWIDDQSSSTD